MNEHTLQIQHLLDEEVEKELASKVTLEARKSFGIISRITPQGTLISKFVVRHNESEPFKTAFLDKALEHYNSINP